MNTWKDAPDRPGYCRKIIQRGPATIIIDRPILSEAEATKTKEKTRTALESVMREYIRRTTA